MRRSGRAAAIALVGICLTAAVSGQEAGELDNEDIVTLTEAGLSVAAIVAVIESSATDFDISVAQLTALAAAGVDSAVSVLTLFDGAMLALFGGFRMASRGDVGNVG